MNLHLPGRRISGQEQSRLSLKGTDRMNCRRLWWRKETSLYQSDRNLILFVCLFARRKLVISCFASGSYFAGPFLSTGALADATAIIRALRFVFTTLT